MKTLLTCLVVLFSTGRLLSQETAWTTYSSNDDQFEIKFPGKFATKTHENGSRQAILESQGGKAFYLITISTFPKEVSVENDETVKTIMGKWLTSSLKRFGENTRLLKQTDGVTEGFPSSDLQMDVPDLGRVYSRMVITPQLAYQMIVIGSKEFVDSPDAKRFRESFKLTQKPAK